MDAQVRYLQMDPIGEFPYWRLSDQYADLPAPTAWSIQWANRVIEMTKDANLPSCVIYVNPDVEGGMGVSFFGNDRLYADMGFDNDGDARMILDDPSEVTPIVLDVVATEDGVRLAFDRIVDFIRRGQDGKVVQQRIRT